MKREARRSSRRAWLRASVGVAATAALGASLLVAAPSVQAATGSATFVERLIPAASDPAASSFPVLNGSLNLANGKSLSLRNPGPYVASAFFATGITGDASAYVGDNQQVYCIEPGVTVGSGNEQDPDFLKNFQMVGGDRVRTIFGGDGDAFVKVLGLVAAHGYSGKPTQQEVASWRWDDPVTGPYLADMVATQILVWETAIGERDQYFNRVAVPAGVSPISDLVFARTAPGYAPYQTMIRTQYDRIVAGVQGDLVMPSFVDDGQVYELTWDGSRFSVTLPGAMAATMDYTSDVVKSEPGLDPGSVTFWVGMDDLAKIPDGSLPDRFVVKAAKKTVPAQMAVWALPGAQAMITSKSDAEPIQGEVAFKVAAGAATVNKVLLPDTRVNDTVTGAGIDYPGSANWFEYTPVTNLSTNPVQTFDLIASRNRLNVGTMTVTNNFNNTVTVSYALKKNCADNLTNDGTGRVALLNSVEELTTVAPGQWPAMQNGSITINLDGTVLTGPDKTTGKGKDKTGPPINDIDSLVVYLNTDAKGDLNTSYATCDTPFYVKVTGPSYPDGQVFSFSVEDPDMIYLAPGEYTLTEVSNAQGDPLDSYWKTTYSTRTVTVTAYDYDSVSATVTNQRR